jgi:hypothetical protein
VHKQQGVQAKGESHLAEGKSKEKSLRIPTASDPVLYTPLTAARVIAFKICTKNMYFYCTQLVSTIDVLHHISEVHVRPVFYFGGLRPQALGVDHAIGAMPRGRLGDGCV